MNRVAIATIIVSAVLLPLAASGQGMTRARELRENIRIVEAGTKDADNFRSLSDEVRMKIENTSGYVVGMCDAWNSDRPGFVPKQVGWLEIMGVVRRFIDAHPERLQDLAADVAKEAVAEAYHQKNVHR
jgi:hypothetical protein